MRKLVIALAVFAGFFGATALLWGQDLTYLNLTCREVETGHILVRYVQNPFGVGGTLEISKSALGGDLVMNCGAE